MSGSATDRHECPTCGKSCKNTHGMRIHHSRVHGEKAPKVCEQCGMTFTPTDYRNKYCSRECSALSQKDRKVVICKECGDNFEVPRCRSDSATFCSEECQDQWKEGRSNESAAKEPVAVECDHCATVFNVVPSRADEARYCSTDCLYKSLSERFSGRGNPSFKSGPATVECDNCSSIFEVIPSRSKKARFCSRQCAGEWVSENMTGNDHPLYNGGYRVYDSAAYEKNRADALKRDGHKCQMCGMKEKAHLSQFDQGLHTHHIRPILNHGENEDPHRVENLITLCNSCHRVAEQMSPLLPDTATSES